MAHWEEQFSASYVRFLTDDDFPLENARHFGVDGKPIIRMQDIHSNMEPYYPEPRTFSASIAEAVASVKEYFVSGSIFGVFKRSISHVRSIGISAFEHAKDLLVNILNFVRITLPTNLLRVFLPIEAALIELANNLFTEMGEKLVSWFGSTHGLCGALVSIFCFFVGACTPTPWALKIAFFILGGVVLYFKTTKVTVFAGVVSAMWAALAPRVKATTESTIWRFQADDDSPKQEDFGSDFTDLLGKFTELCAMGVCCVIGIPMTNNDQWFDRMLKRFSEVGRADQTWEKVKVKVTATFEKAMKFIVKHCMGRNYVSAECIPEVDALYRRTIELCKLEHTLDIGRNIDISNEIGLMFTQFLTFRKIYGANREIARQLDALSAPLMGLYRIVATKNPKSLTMRKEPLCIVLKGGTGVGKSWLMAPLQQTLLKIAGKMPKNGNMDGMIYNRCVEQEFWDGYGGQPIAIYDDFGQARDSQANPNLEYFELIRTVNIFPYNLHSAAINEKANNPFMADFVCVTTNLNSFKPESIVSADALNRRFHITADVSLIPDVQMGVGATQGLRERLSVEKLKAYQASRGVSTEDKSHWIFTVDGQKLTYDQFIVKISHQYRDLVNDFENRTKAADVTAQDTLPEGAFSVDERWTAPIVVSPSVEVVDATPANDELEVVPVKEHWKEFPSGMRRVDSYGTPLFQPFVTPCEDIALASMTARYSGRPPPHPITDPNETCVMQVWHPESPVDGECRICLGDMDEAERTLCGHEFHAECLVRWRAQSRKCPLCRQEIDDVPDPVPEHPYDQYVREQAQEWQRLVDAGAWWHAPRIDTFTPAELGVFDECQKHYRQRHREFRHEMLSAVESGVGFTQAHSLGMSQETQKWGHCYSASQKIIEKIAKKGTRRCVNISNEFPANNFSTIPEADFCPREFGEIGMTTDYGDRPIPYLCRESFSGVWRTQAPSVESGYPDIPIPWSVFASSSRLARQQIVDAGFRVFFDRAYPHIPIDPKVGRVAYFMTVEDVLEELVNQFTYAPSVMDVEVPRAKLDAMNKPKRLGGALPPKENKWVVGLHRARLQFLALAKTAYRGVLLVMEKLGWVKTLCSVIVASATLVGAAFAVRKMVRASTETSWAAEYETKREKDDVRGKQRARYETKREKDDVRGKNRVRYEDVKDPELVRLCKETIPKFESGRAMDDGKRRKCADYEGVVSEQADQLGSKLRQNMYTVIVEVDGDEKVLGLCTALKGHVALINYHYLQHASTFIQPRSKEESDIFLHFRQPEQALGHKMRWSDFITTAQPQYRAKDRTEFYSFRLPPSCPLAADITKHMVTTDDLSKLTRGTSLSIFTYEKNPDGKYSRDCRNGRFQELKVGQCLDERDGKTLHTYPNSAVYDIHTKPGYCGSPLVICSDMFARKLLGFHFAGLPGFGIGSIITRNDVEKLCGSQPSSEPIHLVSVQGEEDLDFPLRDGSFRLIGTISPPIIGSTRTTLKESLVHGMIGPVTTAPVKLAPPLTPGGPMIKGVQKCASAVVPLNEEFVDRAVLSYERRLFSTPITELERKVLSYEDACRGVEGNEFIPPLKRSKSAGWPLMQGAKKGKTEWLGSDDWDFTSPKSLELRAEVNRLEQVCRDGMVPEVYFVDTLKDEKRPFESPGVVKSPRVFAAAPLAFTILYRKYYGSFIGYMTRTRLRSGCSVGINAHSPEWGMMAKKMRKFGKGRCVAGDFKNFDGTCQYYIFRRIVDVINRAYDDGPQNARVREMIWEAIAKSKHLMGNFAYMWSHSQPSGNPGTAPTNSMYALIAMRYVYCLKVGECESYNDNVEDETYGDDNVLAVSPKIGHLFNPDAIAAGFREIGMEYTSETKGATFCSTFRDITEVTYLKRHFVHDEKLDYWFAPLELDSIVQSTHWIRKSPSDRQATIDNCTDAIDELYHHSKTVFTDTVAKIREATRTLDFVPTHYSYERGRALLMEGKLFDLEERAYV